MRELAMLGSGRPDPALSCVPMRGPFAFCDAASSLAISGDFSAGNASAVETRMAVVDVCPMALAKGLKGGIAHAWDGPAIKGALINLGGVVGRSDPVQGPTWLASPYLHADGGRMAG